MILGPRLLMWCSYLADATTLMLCEVEYEMGMQLSPDRELTGSLPLANGPIIVAVWPKGRDVGTVSIDRAISTKGKVVAKIDEL